MRSKRAPRGSDSRWRRAPILDDPAVQQMDLPLTAFGDARIVRNQEQGRAVPCLMLEQAIDDQAAGRGVEISCWFVGQQQFRASDKGPGDRHALLLTSRELPRIMGQAMAEADRGETLGGGGKSVAPPAEFERECYVLERRHRRDQMKGLEHDADVRAAQPGQRILVEHAEVVSIEPRSSGARPLEPANYHHHRGFPGARGTDEAHRLAGSDLDRDAAEDVDGPGRAPQSQVDIFQHHERAAGMKRAGHVPSGSGRAARQTDRPDAASGNRRPRRYGAAAGVFNAMPPRAVAAAVLCLIGAVPAAAHTPVILDFGDSLTAGYGLTPEQTFPARLEATLRRQGIEVRVDNGGVSGDTTAGGLARLDWALADKPDLVILALGANDALRGIDPAAVRDNLDKMIRKIEASGAKVLLVGMLAPPNWGAEYKAAFDRIFPELAKVYGVQLYPFFLEGVAMKPELNQPDGLHPNERGVAVMVDRLAPVVARLVGSPSS
jgi:acyl-CoA thioesterase I